MTALADALDDIGAGWKVLNPCEPHFITELAGYDVALSNLHGPYVEDGRLEGLLDYLRVPYCGSGVAASAVAADTKHGRSRNRLGSFGRSDQQDSVALRSASSPLGAPPILAALTVSGLPRRVPDTPSE
ncbi:hypothetical protein [Streptomyces sp. NPDC058255]|uniref:hypothetical protein n=1 Tax=Streptomyces sp. NPDC058255 TaxID=3346407 RepID=UPI0036E496F2